MEFKELYKTDFQLTDMFAMHQKWSDGACFNILSEGRRTAALLYLSSCRAEYSSNANIGFTAPAGSVIYIPSGSCYKTVFHSEESTGQSILIEFSATAGDSSSITNGKFPFILQSEIPPYTVELFNRAADIYSASVIRYAELKSIIYSLISEFSARDHKKDISSREFAPIAPAILYLEQNPCPTKSIAELSEMCHVSPAYFRRLFHKYAGTSPLSYRNSSRIEYATKLLKKESYSVSEVAAALGFEDTAYFCRAFKKATGYTPGSFMSSEKISPKSVEK